MAKLLDGRGWEIEVPKPPAPAADHHQAGKRTAGGRAGTAGHQAFLPFTAAETQTKSGSYDFPSVSEGLDALVKHPSFPVLHAQAMQISDVSARWGYLLRRAYEIGREISMPLGHLAQNNEAEFKQGLEEYGIKLLCPYFRPDQASLTREYCGIGGEEVMAVCQGKYYSCVIFREMTARAALGEATLPEIKKSPSKSVPKVDAPPVDLQDLQDWWEGEGAYG